MLSYTCTDLYEECSIIIGAVNYKVRIFKLRNVPFVPKCLSGEFSQWMRWLTVHLHQKDFCDMVLIQFIMEHSILPPPHACFGKWRAPPASYDYTPLPSRRMTLVLTQPRNPTDPDAQI